MADPGVQAAKRRQAAGITVFLVLVAAGTCGLYQWVRRDAVAFRRAENAFARGDTARAIADYELARTLGLRVANLDWRLAQALIVAGRKAEALLVLKGHLERRTGDLDALAVTAGLAQELGRPAEALALYANFGPRDRLPPGQLVRLADIHQQAGQIDEAVACARLALRAAPGSADLHVLLGGYLARAERRTEALRELNEALRLQPGHRAGRLALARVLAWEHRYEDSITAYRTYLGQ